MLSSGTYTHLYVQWYTHACTQACMHVHAHAHTWPDKNKVYFLKLNVSGTIGWDRHVGICKITNWFLMYCPGIWALKDTE